MNIYNTPVAAFTYNGDGQRVKSVENGTTTIFVGNYYEVNVTTGEVTKYYYAGATRIAMRKQTVPQNPQVTYLLGDHLGSTSIVTDEAGTLLVETRYKPWGEVRYSTPDVTLPTRYSYTGQYSHMSDEATDLGNVGFGLMFYNARWYDPSLSRFAQADTIIPAEQGVQALDRYAYANNSPINYRDSSGHSVDCGIGETCPEIIVLSGWQDSYAQSQRPDPDNCAAYAIASGMSVVLRHKINGADIVAAFESTYTGRVPPLVPGKLPSTGMIPRAQASAINKLNMGVAAMFSYGNNRQSLINNLQNDVPTIVTVSWDNKTIAHALLVISYNPSNNKFTFMDPWGWGNGKPNESNIIDEDEFETRFKVTFNQAWLNQPWNNPVTTTPSGSMVTLRKEIKNNTSVVSPSFGGGGMPIIWSLR